MIRSVLIANRGEIALTTLPSMGRVVRRSASEGGRGGVFAPTLKALPREAVSETSACLTPSVTLRVTAPPSRGSGRTPC